MSRTQHLFVHVVPLSLHSPACGNPDSMVQGPIASCNPILCQQSCGQHAQLATLAALPCRHDSDHGRRGVQPPHIRDLVGASTGPSCRPVCWMCCNSVVTTIRAAHSCCVPTCVAKRLLLTGCQPPQVGNSQSGAVPAGHRRGVCPGHILRPALRRPTAAAAQHWGPSDAVTVAAVPRAACCVQAGSALGGSETPECSGICIPEDNQSVDRDIIQAAGHVAGAAHTHATSTVSGYCKCLWPLQACTSCNWAGWAAAASAQPQAAPIVECFSCLGYFCYQDFVVCWASCDILLQCTRQSDNSST